jgi:hypothetical protein
MCFSASLEGVWSKRSPILTLELDGINQLSDPATLHRKIKIPENSLKEGYLDRSAELYTWKTHNTFAPDGNRANNFRASSL